MLSIDGGTGEVFLGEVPVAAVAGRRVLRGHRGSGGRGRERPACAPCTGSSSHADERRRLAGARQRRHRRGRGAGPAVRRAGHRPVPHRAHVPRERRATVERLVLATTDDEREAALAALLPLQRADFIEIFTAMDGLPVTIRLLDPPLHEFLPDLDRAVGQGRARARRTASTIEPRTSGCSRRCAGCTRRTRCSGCAGCGSASSSRGCSAMQVRAIAQAAAAVRAARLEVRGRRSWSRWSVPCGSCEAVRGRDLGACSPRRRSATAWSWAPRSAR